MGEPAFVQFPFVGGLDEKTAATYLDPQANQAAILNGSFRYVGRVDKRFGIAADTELSSAAVLNPNGIADPYVSPSLFATALGGLGASIFLGPWTWTVQNGTAAYTGKLPNVTTTRRSLATRGFAPPIICDGVPSIQGLVRAAAWISDPQQPYGNSGSATWLIQSALLDPASSSTLSSFPTLAIVAANITLVNLVWFPVTGVLTLFVIVETATSASRELRAYNVTPANNSNVWTLQAGATLALYNDDTTSLDVQPMVGDPSDGYIVLYLPSSADTTMHWRYYTAFSSVATGSLAGGVQPGLYTCHIIADWGVDVVFMWSDEVSSVSVLHFDYFSADGLFSAITTSTAGPIATFGFNYALVNFGGACRLYSKTNSTLNSEIYVSFWAPDVTNYSSGGPAMPVTMGGVVSRSGVNVVTYMGFVYYPYGLIPIARPMQPDDGQQVVGSYVHVYHPCVQCFRLFLATKGGIVGSTPIDQVTAINQPSEQVTEYLVDFRVSAQSGVPLSLRTTQATISATVAPRQLDPYLARWSNPTFLPLSASADRSAALSPIALAGSGPSGTGVDVSTMWLVEFTGAAQPESAIINDTTELSGSVLTRLADTTTEHGFVAFPEFITASLDGAGNLSGTYSYAVLYGRQDRAGNIERSSPVILPTPIVPAANAVELTFPQLPWTNDGGAYWIEIYRTVTLGSTYYLLDRVDSASISSFLFASYVDSGSIDDATVSRASLLYTTGGVLDAVNPPAARHACAHRARLAIVDETLSNVWFTQSETSGEVMGFNEVLICPFVEGGDITAIASMDDKLIAFKASSLYVMFGDGPADTGQGSDWTIPQKVPSDVGCVSAPSLVTIPQGIVFLSAIGFHLLGRDTSVAYIGKSVQTTIATYSTCISSCVVPSAKQARWVMQDANGNQRVICFDYFLSQWTVHQYAYLDGPIAQIFLDDANIYTVLTSVGGRYKETSTSYLDVDMAAASHFVPLSVTSPWIKISGPQGYMMARNTLVYGEQQDAAGLQVQLCYNYNSTPRKTAMWTNARLEARPTEQVQVHSPGPYAKCEAIQVVLTDVDDAARVTGQGFTFDAIAFDLVKIGDRYRRLPARLKA